jgi:hypothetical protein
MALFIYTRRTTKALLKGHFLAIGTILAVDSIDLSAEIR